MATRLLILLLLMQAAATSAQDLQHLGDFHNVSSKDGGEHCAGYSLGLWKYRDQIIGLLDVQQGLCGDPPCGVIQDAKLHPKTGRLEFWSLINDQRIQFDGTMTRARIDGVFNGRGARLVRDTDRMGSDFEPNRSISSWCRFWSSVPRCGGVRELCDSINVPGVKSRAARDPAQRSDRQAAAPLTCP
jgi:hypothetical protein